MSSKIRIRDPIHGDIELNEVEWSLLQTRALRRLQDIKQLGVTYHSTFHGATHTRYEHSIGTMYLASLAFDRIKEINNPPPGVLTDSDRDELRLAALLHDVGHGPFSHVIEEFLNRNKHYVKKVNGIELKNHEAFTKYIVLNDPEITEIIKKTGYSESEIAKIAVGEPIDKKSYLTEILTGDLGVDRMDYLIRDSHYCGISYGFGLDIEQLLSGIEVERRGDIFRLALKEEGIDAAEALLIARYHHLRLIVCHPATRKAQKILLKSFEYALDQYASAKGGDKNEVISDIIFHMFTEFDDREFLNFLENPLKGISSTEPSVQKMKKDLENSRKSKNLLVHKFLEKQLPQYSTSYRFRDCAPTLRYNIYRLIKNGISIDIEKELISKLSKGKNTSEENNVYIDYPIFEGLPREAFIRTTSGDAFLYDYSPIILSMGQNVILYSEFSFYSYNHEVKYSPNEIIEATNNILKNIRETELAENKISSLDFLLLVFYTIYETCKTEYNMPFIYFRSRKHFYNFMKVLLENLKSNSPNYNLNSLYIGLFQNTDLPFYYDRELFEDIQTLCALGMLEEKITLVPVSHGTFYRKRFDYRLNQFGIEYVCNYLLEIYGNLHLQLKEVLSKLWDKYKNDSTKLTLLYSDENKPEIQRDKNKLSEIDEKIRSICKTLVMDVGP